MTEVEVNRWRKYGKDRLYVGIVDGVRIGWLDLVSGERVIERPDLQDLFESALASEGILRTATPSTPAPSAAPMPQPSQPTAPRGFDLAQNKPGQAAREQANAHREAMRERSKVMTFLARALDVKTDERAWRVGADGEETVGAQLASLDKHGWRFLHAVEVGERGSDIDHVAIGPGGVYTLNTKNHLGHRIVVYERAILVGGFKQPYLRNSQHEAKRASRLLTTACGYQVKAAPLIVVLCDELIVKRQPPNVQVVGRRDIARWLQKRPTVLSPSQIDAIWDHARRSTTWQPAKDS